MTTVMTQRPDRVSLTQACHALGLNRSTVYARRHRAAHDAPPRRPRRQGVQPRALSEAERTTVIDTLHSEAYCDQPPAEAYQRLLEQGRYISGVLTEAIEDYVRRYRIRPDVLKHLDDSIRENERLGQLLAE